MLLPAGHGTFATSNIATCPPNQQIPRTVSNPFDCQNVVNFLSGTPQGGAFAASHGGVNQAVHLFILPGSAGDPQKYLFITAFAAVMVGCINAAREIRKQDPIYRRERAV